MCRLNQCGLDQDDLSRFEAGLSRERGLPTSTFLVFLRRSHR